MKARVVLSSHDIDKVLTDKCDLGYLLDQIANKNINFTPPVADVLRFVPKFADKVKEIRNTLKIDQPLVRKTLSSLVGKASFDRYVSDTQNIARGIYPPLNQDWELINLQIMAWKKETFPLLASKVGNLRLKTLGKAPYIWQEAIEDYILFDLINPTPALYRQRGPQVSLKFDDETQEQYIEMRIYADTDPKFIPTYRQLKKMQKTLPGYLDPSVLNPNIFVARFMQYVLKKHLMLDQQTITEWLEMNNFVAPDYEHTSQEIKRFESLFSR